MAAAKRNRHGHHDATMILVSYRHGEAHIQGSPAHSQARLRLGLSNEGTTPALCSLTVATGISSTPWRYTELSPTRLKDFWRIRHRYRNC